jgi:molybdopterin-containing oxidoreductase family iron-sulfur binding subunit
MSQETTPARTYWKSLNDLAQNETFRKHVDNEFTEGTVDQPSKHTRRSFVELMGASVALAGLAACRRPVEKIVPHVKQAEYQVSGKPVYYASAMPMAGSALGVLIETHEGRPIKIEGNPDHPSSLGASSKWAQAATLSLYDRDRARTVTSGGAKKSWADFLTFTEGHFVTGKKVLVIASDYASPALDAQKQTFLKKFAGSRWITYDAFSEENVFAGNKLAFGKSLRSSNRFDAAKVIVSFGDDFLDSPFNGVAQARAFAKARSVENGQTPVRLYTAEANYSITGTMADARRRTKTADTGALVMALAAKLGLSGYAGADAAFTGDTWLEAAAKDLASAKGASVVSAGFHLAPEIHAVVAAINVALGNSGKTVHYVAVSETERGIATVTQALADVKAGIFDTIVVLGANPAFTLPASAGYADAVNGKTVIALGNHFDETGKAATWHIAESSFMEAWGDVRSFDGHYSVIQPVIAPLFESKSALEVIASLNGDKSSALDLVKASAKAFVGGLFDDGFATLLHDGVAKDSSFKPEPVTISASFNVKPVVTAVETEINVLPDPKILDGRFANNGWLMELPDNLSKLTWDNVALASVTTAAKYGITSNIGTTGETSAELVDFVFENGSRATLPVWVLPGHADDSFTIYSGYGRQSIGRVADGNGFNVAGAVSASNPFHSAVKAVSKTGQLYPVASTQDHHSMEGRALVREADITEFRNKPTFAKDMVKVPGQDKADQNGAIVSKNVQLFGDIPFKADEPQWGMTIDLNSCIGCGVCTIACQSENNIPIVGKKQVRKGRELHWIRVDRYFNTTSDDASLDSAQVVHQPVTCQHCEMAPCEQVCPVAATVHSDDGMNQMTYNRCVGTRYCANNCPYKVRRYNFFNYPKEFFLTGDETEIVHMVNNPEVTVRFRGVMEKCTFCVQRVTRAKHERKMATGNQSKKPEDGAVKTACQQACPVEAIQFGDLTDANSIVSRKKQDDRNYLLLEEINVRPRLSYLAKIRNQQQEIA